MGLRLSSGDRELLAGERGEAGRLAMRILVRMAEVYGAGELLDIVSAHVDGCLYHGLSGLEFAGRLVDGGAAVAVPTTLNVGAMDLLHASNFNGSPALAERATRLMRAYESMGCRPTWTCAPYQAGHRPAAGDQVAWAESNAIAFVNSVLGARTNRYGDFIDICAAITGRAPACGLHLDRNRRGRIVYRLEGLPPRLLENPVLAPVLGYHVGADCRTLVPVLSGLPAHTGEDFLKALGAAAASSGAVALFHVVGVTPEAPTLEAALHGEEADREVVVTLEDLKRTRDRLSTGRDGALAAVALGSPHFSYEEFARLVPLIERRPPAPGVEFIVCTHRLVLARIEPVGWLEALRAAGVRVVVDTCVVVTPILRSVTGSLMTDSGKFAHYTPSNTGLDVIFGSLEECVRSAAAGRVWRDPEASGGSAASGGPGPWRVEMKALRGRPLVAGAARGTALVLEEPLSLWGGLDPETGRIIDRRHPQLDSRVTDRVVVLPVGRGSSSASSILLEAVRLGTAPAAILLGELDAILALGATVARELYERGPAVIVLEPDAYRFLRTGMEVTIAEDGGVTVEAPAGGRPHS